jgi:hypothetical protein
VTLVVTNYKQVREINLFAFVLVVQSLPFLAAVSLALIEDSRFNAFAYWHGLEAKIAALLPQRRVVTEAVTQAVTQAVAQAMTQAVAEPPKVPADNRIEAAQ